MQTNNSSNKNDQGLNIVDLFMYFGFSMEVVLTFHFDLRWDCVV